MKANLFLFILIPFFVSSPFAQLWYTTRGLPNQDERAWGADGDSMIYVAGATSSYGHVNGDYDIFVLKYDSAGALIDSLIWGGARRETAHDMAMSGDYLYITGETCSFGNAQTDGHHADGLLLKLNGRTMQAPDTVMTKVVSSHLPLCGYELQQNYPNPFNPATAISYQLAAVSHVDLSIYNSIGQKVCTMVAERQNAGRYQVRWDAGGLASGVYLCRLQAGEFIQTKKLILMR